MKNFTYVFLFFIFTIAQFISAQIPHTVSYQGILTDNKGNLVPDGNVSLTFRLYNATEGGDTLWQETQQITVSKGIFNVVLGSIEPLNLPFDQQYWLGITIDGNEELTPRTALTASPYSLNSHSTLTEPEPGQDLLIKNSGGEITHEISANGDVKHTGTGTFLGGIVVGDTTILPTDSLMRIFDTNIKFHKKNIKYKNLLNLPSIGVKGYGTLNGVLGVLSSSSGDAGVEGHAVNKIGVYGYSAVGKGVYGFSGNYGVVGQGDEAGVWAQGKLKVDSVPTAPNQERFLVWDNDNFVKYRTLTAGGGSFNGTLDDMPLVLRDAKGDTVFSVMTNGESIHKGEETFFDGITLTDTSYRSGILIDKNSIQIYDDSPDILGIKIPIGILGSRRFEYLKSCLLI